MNKHLSAKSLSYLIFGFESRDLDDIKYFHRRRLGAPDTDTNHIFITKDIAEYIRELDPDSSYLVVVEHDDKDPHYFTLWTPVNWRESNERKYLGSKLRQVWRKEHEIHNYNINRFHTMAVKLRDTIPKSQLGWALGIITVLFENSKAQSTVGGVTDNILTEELFKTNLSKICYAKSIYIPPYQETREVENPETKPDDATPGSSNEETNAREQVTSDH